MTSQPSARRDRRAATIAERRQARDKARARAVGGGSSTAKTFTFAAVVIGVLAIGAYLAFGDFFNRPGAASAGVINVQSSMAGFNPSTITVKAGDTVTLAWWTQDAAPHLTNGVHTMVSDELGFYEELPAESSRNVVWNVPNKPGTYDVWCESCCGGKEAPQMHGKIVIQPADSAAETTWAAA